jgi:metalloprotease
MVAKNLLTNVLCALLFTGIALSTSATVAVPQYQNPALNGTNVNWMSAGMDAFRAMTISERQIMMQASQYAAQSDVQNRVAAAGNPYTIRLQKLTARHVQDNGLRLNYRVYLSPMVNAFALADGSVRVYSGLMDMMTDEEILGVIGHEIGHVKNGDHKAKLRTALLTSAARKAAAGSNSMLGQLAVSGAGALAEAYINAKFSRSQELNADDYGLQFMQRNGYQTRAMATALAKLAKLAAGRSNAVQQMFSTHPDPKARALRMAKAAGMAVR